MREKFFFWEHSLLVHVEFTHPELIDNQTAEVSSDTPLLSCRKCTTQFFRPTLLKYHELICDRKFVGLKNKNAAFFCRKCDACFNDERILRIHNQLCTANKPINKSRLWSCKRCMKLQEFASNSELRLHRVYQCSASVDLAADSPTWTCFTCLHHFNDRRMLELHLPRCYRRLGLEAPYPIQNRYDK